MCLGIPGELVEFGQEHEDLAVVDVSGVRRRVHVGLLADEGLRPGDWVLVHVGFALSKISEREAQAVLDYLQGLGQPYEDELDALRGSDIV
ncbi:HypC/HybG/HupF family hydrogenase formation chaperone [Nonomuraea sp. KC401]|uniref:HypC/HybG/HupF family hydrogenase formation chaperone n=1 Tax=unclassified Nonomuraea TaxID=2593643 RepID=UPI0010FEC6E8|nr:MULTISPECIES: HypC/HybG/HupF family hydrogenase formation chaperone [unclassified Nonomuraea]NBE97723.1 HypC/HybG/HupF family hydrogenase formation chaperone [Nonomuraea sp. K271]TLF63823.1 HypC/HybG/HupF family hydrogenase formation chaperone [Nonomuraea sp. KC401]